MAQQLSSEDGRVARRLDNRVRILDALFALIRNGRPHPTLKEIRELLKPGIERFVVGEIGYFVRELIHGDVQQRIQPSRFEAY